jgi:hypothetical protein
MSPSSALLVVGTSPSLTRCESGLKSGVGSYTRRHGGIIPSRSPPLNLSLDAAERIYFFKDHLNRRIGSS